MDKETKAQYLDDPTYCPYCNGICYIIGNLTMEDDNTATQEKECEECSKKWFDRFKLVDIIEIK